MKNPYFRGTLFTVCCLVGAYSVSIWGPSLRGQEPKSTYSYPDGGEHVIRGAPYILRGWESLRVGGGCVAIGGALGAGRFFLDLKRKNTAQGPVFRVGHKIVTEFPERVLVVITLSSGVPCSRGKPPEAVIPSLDALKSPRGEAVYIRDLRMYPLEINLEAEGSDSPPGVTPLSITMNRVWYYRFDLETKGVRLTDALVISLFSKEGTKIAQLSWRQ